jgi:hypothetical protein
MAAQLTIAERFNGPPGSGNGGYVCGQLARLVEGPSCEVNLRAPPPLATPLAIVRDGDGVRLMHDGAIIADACPVSFDLQAPAAPHMSEADATRARYRGLIAHAYPTCFVCGPSRPGHDGLDIFTGPIDGRDMAAASWTPAPDLFENGKLAPEFLYAALDCPSYWALPRAGEMPALLGRMTARLDGALPRAGEPLIVAAWPISSEGRKHRGGSAVYGADGRPIAVAEALWIEPKSA